MGEIRYPGPVPGPAAQERRVRPGRGQHLVPVPGERGVPELERGVGVEYGEAESGVGME